jgi:hypothetical protein
VKSDSSRKVWGQFGVNLRRFKFETKSINIIRTKLCCWTKENVSLTKFQVFPEDKSEEIGARRLP